ncbi:hypothetical protein B0H14DRAFT_3563433 [Mycena olivaceomarginata]|nr:hypothetical protein B0H14DRAFT_3563433 [Mycena olivaceomarginata]
MSTESKPLVLVTGAAGYLGFEVVYQLLEAGYSVRGAARGRKIPLLKTALEKYPKFEVVEIADVATADFSAAFKGFEGSLHILREARKASIKKVVVTGSMVTFPEDSFGENDWVPVTKEQALKGNDFTLYIAEKKFGEQAMDITIFCPPWIFGPFAPGFEHIVPTPDFAAFSTNGFVYQLLRAENTNYHYSPGVLDVRDVARAHIAGLQPLTSNHPKRVPLASPYDGDFRDAILYISEARPELRARLADPSTVPVWPSYKLAVDLKPVEEAFWHRARVV